MVDMSARDHDVIVALDPLDIRADLNRGGVSYTSGVRDIPAIPVPPGTFVRQDNEVVIVGDVAALIVAPLAFVPSEDRPVALKRPGVRRSPQEMVDRVNARYPNIMARLAE